MAESVNLLSEALQAACTASQDIPVSSPESEDIQFTVDARFMSFLLKNEPIWAALRKALSTLPRFDQLIGKRMRVESLSGYSSGYSESQIDLLDMGRWMIMRARAVGHAQAVEEMKRFVENNTSDVFDYFAVTGVTVTDPIDITTSIKLLPYPTTPFLLGSTSIPGFDKSGVFGDHGRSPPSALVQRVRVQHPIFAEHFDTAIPQQRDLLTDVILALPLIKPGAVLPRGYWIRVPDSTPLINRAVIKGRISYGIDTSFGIFENFTITDVNAEPIRQFLKLKEEDRARQLLPLARLNLSFMRHAIVDQSVELGISFEALLISGETKKSLMEVARTRIAALLPDDAFEQEQAISIYNRFYDIRSQAVHTGAVDPKPRNIRNVQQRATPVDVLTHAQKLCARLIKKVIELGTFPSWPTLIEPQLCQSCTLCASCVAGDTVPRESAAADS